MKPLSVYRCGGLCSWLQKMKAVEDLSALKTGSCNAYFKHPISGT